MTTEPELSTDAYRKIAILCVLAKHPLIKAEDMSRLTNIPGISIKRHLARLRNDFMVDIVFVRSSGMRGRTGGYEVRDWGIIDQDELLKRYGDLIPEDIDVSVALDIPIKQGISKVKAKKAPAKRVATKKATVKKVAAKKAATKRSASKRTA